MSCCHQGHGLLLYKGHELPLPSGTWAPAMWGMSCRCHQGHGLLLCGAWASAAIKDMGCYFKGHELLLLLLSRAWAAAAAVWGMSCCYKVHWLLLLSGSWHSAAVWGMS